jgi:hypothetical protein
MIERDPEAIVYMIGNNWCGSGGCNTLILTPHANSWSIVTDISITLPPIYVLTDKSNGWHSIGVWVQGGGIQPGYEAELRFDGKTYPDNPTVPSAQRLSRNPTGKMVIATTQNALLLYGDGAKPPAMSLSVRRSLCDWFTEGFDAKDSQEGKSHSASIS